jgi:predicted NBD/HSP70 family sugar kinase
LRNRPILDPNFLPAAVWNRTYRRRVHESDGDPLTIALEREPGAVSAFETRILPHAGDCVELNHRYVERLLKFLLWQKGAHKITVAGNPEIAGYLRSVYSPTGARAFDCRFMGERVYKAPFTIESCAIEDAPRPSEKTASLGRQFKGCRIGFDLGGSDRKCAAMIDSNVVFTEEVVWDPYYQTDPCYHFEGIDDSLRRAAAHLPQVDAIGGSAAGVYIDNEPRVASIFRGVSPERFESHVRPIFHRLRERWNNVPFLVVNDGEVAALGASMALRDNAVLGISMGTSQAAGYVTPEGYITDWLDELAFAPIDYREDAPRDEWSGDCGVGAQYFSQQAVARLLPVAGIEVPADMPFAQRLLHLQELMSAGDERARRVFETIGTYFGYAIAHYADFYELRHVQAMGRVTSGDGGDVILAEARRVLEAEFPEHAAIRLHLPSEQDKRHGQAAAAATLPALEGTRGDSRVPDAPGKNAAVAAFPLS